MKKKIQPKNKINNNNLVFIVLKTEVVMFCGHLFFSNSRILRMNKGIFFCNALLLTNCFLTYIITLG